MSLDPNPLYKQNLDLDTLYRQNLELLRQDPSILNQVTGSPQTLPAAGTTPAAGTGATGTGFWNMLKGVGSALYAPFRGWFSGGGQPAARPAVQPSVQPAAQPGSSFSWTPIQATTPNALKAGLVAAGLAGGAAPFLLNHGGVQGPIRMAQQGNNLYVQSTQVNPGAVQQGYTTSQAPGQFSSVDQIKQTDRGWYFNHQGAIKNAQGQVVGYQNPVWLNSKTGQYIRADQVMKNDGGWGYKGTQYATGHYDLTRDGPVDSLKHDPQKVVNFFNNQNFYDPYAKGDHLYGGNMRFVRGNDQRPNVITSDGRHFTDLINRRFDTTQVPANHPTIFNHNDLNSFDRGTGTWGAGNANPGMGTGPAVPNEDGASLNRDTGMGGGFGGGPSLNQLGGEPTPMNDLNGMMS